MPKGLYKKLARRPSILSGGSSRWKENIKMETVIEITPEAQKIIKQTEIMVKNYQNYSIIAQEQYTGAAEHLKLIKGKYDELETLRKSLTRPLDESKKKIMELFRKPLETLSNAENFIKRAMLSWQQKKEQERKAEEERLRKLQEKEAEKLRNRAEEAEAKGKAEKAEELRTAADTKESLTPIVAPTIEKISGITTKTVWKFRIVDANKIPREHLIPDMKRLGDIARATRGTLKISGVEFFCEEVIASGR